MYLVHFITTRCLYHRVSHLVILLRGTFLAEFVIPQMEYEGMPLPRLHRRYFITSIVTIHELSPPHRTNGVVGGLRPKLGHVKLLYRIPSYPNTKHSKKVMRDLRHSRSWRGNTVLRARGSRGAGRLHDRADCTETMGAGHGHMVLVPARARSEAPALSLSLSLSPRCH
jgi:hypothetical protein